MTPIVNQVADFLKDFEPFNSLIYNELIDVSSNIKVFNLEKNKSLFQINDALHNDFYLVFSGVIHLTTIADAEETLLNKCKTGDVFGLRPFFAKNNYMMNATAREESIIYAIPITVFKPLLAKNSEVLDFLLESFASTSTLSKDNGNSKDAILHNETQAEIQYFQSLEYNKKPIIAINTKTIREVAELMSDSYSDSVLITENNFPIGIVTDWDFKSKVGTGLFSILSTIDKIMSAPVITVSENLSLAEAQLLMLKYSVSHLCVTLNGSDKSEIKGIISEHDLVVAQTNNPGVLMKEIKKAQNGKDLKKSREKLTALIQSSMTKNIPISHISAISGEIIFSIIKRAIELSILELGAPPTRFAWFSIGSQARKEQLLLTDQDSFLVFDDVSAENYRDVRDYFLKLAKKATAILEKLGYYYCPNNHIASNILFCKSLTDWTKHFENWINEPTESEDEICDIFLDFDLVYGETTFEKQLTDIVYQNRKNNSRLYDFLGNITLKMPLPLSFFKKINIEEDGENKGKFDIKNRAIMPLVDGARLLILSQNVSGIQNTNLRYKQLALIEPKYKEIYKNCAEAFNELTRLSTLEGLKNDNNGQYINIVELSKTDKEKLKSSFLAFKELEEIIKSKFTLTHYS